MCYLHPTNELSPEEQDDQVVDSIGFPGPYPMLVENLGFILTYPCRSREDLIRSFS